MDRLFWAIMTPLVFALVWLLACLPVVLVNDSWCHDLATARGGTALESRTPLVAWTGARKCVWADGEGRVRVTKEPPND